MPLAHARSVTFALALLAACGGGGTYGTVTPPGQPAGAASIVVKEWPAGQSGTLRFYRNVFGGALLSEVPIDAQGRASYALPVPPGLFGFDPTPGLTIDPPDALYQVIIAINVVPSPGQGETGQVWLRNGSVHSVPAAGDKLVELTYVDRDVTITGESGGCTYAEPLKAGWNFVMNEILTVTPAFACRVTSSTTLPPGVDWHYLFIGL